MSAVDSPHLILFEFFIKIPSPVTRALCFLTCLYILCARLCAHVNGSVSACLQSGNRQSFSVKCNKVSAALHASVRNLMPPIYFYCNISLISKYCPSPEVCEGLMRNSRLRTGHPAADSPVSQCLLFWGPRRSLECRSLQVTDKAW